MRSILSITILKIKFLRHQSLALLKCRKECLVINSYCLTIQTN